MEHIGGSEVFMCSSLSVRSATLFDIPPCLQFSMFTYTDHHKHPLWPPLVLVATCSTRVFLSSTLTNRPHLLLYSSQKEYKALGCTIVK